MVNDITFGPGDSLTPEPPSPRIDVTQADITEIQRYHELEIRGRDFPLSVAEIREVLKNEDQYSVKITLNYRLQGWCSFHVMDGNLVVDHLAIRDEAFLPFILQAIWQTITYTPKASAIRNPKVTVLWPLHATDRPVFRELQNDGWKPGGTIKQHFHGYGSWWDAVKMERQF